MRLSIETDCNLRLRSLQRLNSFCRASYCFWYEYETSSSLDLPIWSERVFISYRNSINFLAISFLLGGLQQERVSSQGQALRILAGLCMLGQRLICMQQWHHNIKSFQMRIVWILLLVAAVLSQELIKFSLSSYILPDKKLEMELDVSAPRSPSEYSVILYMTGQSGLTPSFTQSVLIDSIAQAGNIFLTVTKLSTPSATHAAEILGHVITWINENMQQVLNNRAPGVIADLENRFILMGHSGGGQITTQFLNSSCQNVKLHILLDPVDGVDLFGTKKSYVITPGKMLPYATPVLVIASQLDNTKKDLLPACAANNVSNLRFYDAMSGPKWFLNISKYGHCDFFNNQYRDVFGVNCVTCRKDCVYNDYRTTVKEAVLSFIDAIFYKSELALSIVQNAKFRIPTDHRHNYTGYDPKRGGFCERKNSHIQSESS